MCNNNFENLTKKNINLHKCLPNFKLRGFTCVICLTIPVNLLFMTVALFNSVKINGNLLGIDKI